MGKPRAVTDKDNAVLWRWEGDAFGDITRQIDAIEMPLRMAGQYRDNETGLFYNYFRFYDPQTGRYVENDPIGLKGGLNIFAYADNNPLKLTDPKGKSPVVIGIGVGTATWLGACSLYSFVLGQNFETTNAVNDNLPSNDTDKKHHCYASCVLIKCMVGLPFAPSVGVLKEAVDYFKTDGEFSIDDIRANNVGVTYAYAGKECKECDGEYCD